MRRLFPVLLAAILLATPAAAQSATEKLRRDLLSATSATQVLTQYCTTLKLASPPVIKALRDPVAIAAPAEVRAALNAGADETIRHRRVKLACGAHVLSNADNWYLPARLTPEMNRQLDESETPFGTVVRPLNFHRRTLEAVAGTDPVLRIRALLLTADETPFSLVIENYSPELAR